MAKYQITLDSEQLLTLFGATEVYSRLSIGQIRTALDQCWSHKLWALPADTRNLIEQKCRVITLLLSEGKCDGYQSSYGIYSPEIDKHGLTSFNIHQVLRHQLWKEQPEDKRSTMTVDSSVCITNGETPIVITKIED
jgi:hypothetical protein